MIKFIVSGCWHFDKVIDGYDMHSHIVEAAQMVIDETQNADCFVFLGDMFDNCRPSPRAYAAVTELLYEVGCPTIILKGNHDESRGLTPDALEPLRKIKFPEEISFIDTPGFKIIEGKCFGFLGFSNESKLRKIFPDQVVENAVEEYIDKILRMEIIDIDGKKIKHVEAIFTHVDLEGFAYDGGFKQKKSWLSLQLDKAKKLPCYVIAGHIHHQMKLSPNIWIPGSIVPTNFSATIVEHGMLILKF